MTEERDQITHLIGNFGKWQALIILPLGLHFIFGSFPTLVTTFLSLEGDFYCQIEAPDGVFESLEQWRNFSNPIKVSSACYFEYQSHTKKVCFQNGTVDKCNIYELDYSLLSQLAMERGATAEEYVKEGDLVTTKNCTSFVFDQTNFESSIVTDVSFLAFIDTKFS